MNSNVFAALLLSLLPFAILVVYVFVFIAWCRLFKKAGLPWERMFVPLYGSYWMYKIARSASLFWINICTAIAYLLFTSLIAVNSVYLSKELGIPSLIFAVVMLVLSILYNIRLARVFGKGGGFAAGLILLNPIFIMILGFGSAQYVALGSACANPAEKSRGCPDCGASTPAHRATCQDCGHRPA